MNFGKIIKRSAWFLVGVNLGLLIALILLDLATGTSFMWLGISLFLAVMLEREYQ